MVAYGDLSQNRYFPTTHATSPVGDFSVFKRIKKFYAELRREFVTKSTSGGCGQFETSPEAIEPQMLKLFCERRQTDRLKTNYRVDENKRRCRYNECNRFTECMETVSVCGMYASGDVVFETFTTDTA